MNFGDRFSKYFNTIEPSNDKLPQDVDWLYPYGQKEVQECVSSFADKYYAGSHDRTFLFGINPGRFGAGVTGVSFTDPVQMNRIGVENDFDQRAELSSQFIYEMIDALGGAEPFYNSFYIGSVCPLGFVKDGKNLNYYDEKPLETALTDWITEQIEAQIDFGANREIAYSIGKGKNLKFLEKLNKQHGWFKRIDTIPHPRWVMQYRRKQKPQILESIIEKLGPHIK